MDMKLSYKNCYYKMLASYLKTTLGIPETEHMIRSHKKITDIFSVTVRPQMVISSFFLYWSLNNTQKLACL